MKAKSPIFVRMIGLVGCFALMGIAKPAHAMEADFSISAIRIFEGGGVRVYLNENVDGFNCKYSPTAVGSWLDFDSTTPGGKSILSTLLAAKLASKRVYFGYDGGSGVTKCMIHFAQL